MKRILLFLFITGALYLSSSSCRKDRYTLDKNAKLSFSTDTVHFDTVFTQVGSATQYMVVRNPNTLGVHTTVRLAGGEHSPFRINIDGRATTEFKDVEIAANDSFFIFVEVTVDPNNQATPFVVTDSILFETNGKVQKVILDAFGQNAHIHSQSVIGCNEVWTNDMPHLLYGINLIQNGCKLTIEKGTKIFGHKYALLEVGGQLEVKGTKQDPVIFRGDRTEEKYDESVAEWWGIHFEPKSENNTITHAKILNATQAIRVDSLGNTPGAKKITIDKSEVAYAYQGIIGFTSKIDLRNSLVYSCNLLTVAASLGGTYTFTHCTFDDTHTSGAGRKASVYFDNEDYNGIHNDLNLQFRNCIIWGSLDDEINVENIGHGKFDTLFTHNIIKTTEKTFNGINLVNKYPNFHNTDKGDYKLDTLSPAKDYGILFPAPFNVIDDKEDNPRDSKPDVGCFERKE